MSDSLVEQVAKQAELQEKRKNALLKFPISRVGSLELHSPVWLARDFLEVGALGMVFGESGAGKSFLVIDLGLCVAAGLDWHGRTVEKGIVIYICGEGRSGVLRRVNAWAKARKVDISQIPFYLTAGAVNLNDPGTMEMVRLAIDAISIEAGPPVLIIVDTWAANLGGDENSTPESTAGVVALQALRAPFGAAGIVVHHVGVADKKRARGSSALKASMDMEFLVEHGEDQIVRVVNTKSKDCEPPEPIAFTLDQVDLGLVDDSGRPVQSAVLNTCEYEPEAPRENYSDKRTTSDPILLALKKATDGLSVHTLNYMTGKEENTIRAALSRLSSKGLVEKREEKWFLK